MDSPGSSSGQSGPENTAGKKRKLPVKLIPKQMVMVAGTPIGYLEMTKPSGLRPELRPGVVCLDLKDTNDAFSFEIFTKIHHKNVLHLETIIENTIKGSSWMLLCVEKHSGPLESYLTDDFFHTSGGAFPSVEFQRVVRDTIKGLYELNINGLYHGNFNLQNTYYNKENGLVKLSNFKKKVGTELTVAQREDLHAVGKALDDLRIAKGLKYSLISDLAEKLQNIPHGMTLKQFIDYILDDHAFFWSKSRREKFFIVDIGNAIFRTSFLNALDSLTNPHIKICEVPWNKHTLDDFLNIMNGYRKKKSLDDYDVNSYVHLVMYVSACYTHDEEDGLSEHAKVDESMQSDFPNLCFELKKILDAGN